MGDPMGISDSPSPLTTACQFTCVCAAAVSDKREPRAVVSPHRRREGRVGGAGGAGGRAGSGRRDGGGSGWSGVAPRLPLKPLRIFFEHMLPQILDDVDVERLGHKPGHIRLQAAAWTTQGCSLGTAWMHGVAAASPEGFRRHGSAPGLGPGLGWGGARPRARAATDRAGPKGGRERVSD